MTKGRYIGCIYYYWYMKKKVTAALQHTSTASGFLASASGGIRGELKLLALAWLIHPDFWGVRHAACSKFKIKAAFLELRAPK